MNLNDLGPIAIAFVFIAVVLGVGATILSDIEADQTTGSYSENASLNGLDAVDTLAGWLPTIALVVAAAVVIGVLSFFRGR